ncbi:LOW QUALITY PROTEIN: hypothetical protein MXB_849 [Myxobolus squamalis]|nr:LOW QUALITY PROTEIN: hypothetical protein MXB_849 [Myxobolus squamalis]
MPRDRSSSTSLRTSNRRRPAKDIPQKSRKQRSSSSETSKPNSPRRSTIGRRRSLPRRPKSPVGRRRPVDRNYFIQKRSHSSSRSGSSSNRGRSSSRSSSSSASRSRGSSRSSSSSYSSSSASPPRRIQKAVRRSPLRRSPADRRSVRLTVKRDQPRIAKESPIKTKCNNEEIGKKDIKRDPIKDSSKVISNALDKKLSNSRFHDKKSISISPEKSKKNLDVLKKDVTRDIKHSTKKEAAPKPRSSTVHISNITRNVREPHIREIFGVYGKIVEMDLPLSNGFDLPLGYARVKYDKSSEAELAQEYMKGGQIDGSTIGVDVIRSSSVGSPDNGRRRRCLSSVDKPRKRRDSPDRSLTRRRRRDSISPHRRRR